MPSMRRNHVNKCLGGMTVRFIFLFIVLTVCTIESYSQKKYSIKSRKAIHYYEQAGQFYRNRDARQALEQLNKAIDQESKFIEAWLFKADVLNGLGEAEREIEAYKKAIAIDGTFFPNVHFNLANAYLKRGQYKGALLKYEDFLSFPNITQRNANLANKRIRQCEFALEMVANPVEFNPVNLGEAINSEYDEYWPSLTADEEVLVFTRLSPQEKEVKLKWQEDFWVSYKTDSIWRPAQELSASINTKSNEGAQSITADGQYMYFTACNRSTGYGRCDIYYSVREGDHWSVPFNIGKPVNSAAWDAQPSISADGRILYFVSNRKSGKGKMDIWKSYLLETFNDGRQRWSQPVNLPINTRDNEMSPFIHAGNEYLVFASDGMLGMGGFDLYKITKEKDNQWSKAVNLGYPINTHGDELGMVINAKGDMAYFSSDRLEGKGKDIFTFKVPVKHQPPAASWLKGRVYDEDSKQALFASLLLIDLNQKDTIASLHSDRKNGNYLICLPSGKEYSFAVEADGYLFYSDHFSMLEGKKKDNPQVMDIPMKKMRVGQEIVLRNVFFKVDSWDILPQSELELNKLVVLLQKRDRLKVEIGGHTDNTGGKEHNKTLSKNRAKAVCDYLISKGINESRLTFVGYGADKPIASNSTEKGKAQNRRTEFKIVKEGIDQ
eukprot:TRINITY_DN4076_c0_g1_i1.p2 TRINITY_DN4076_c0_g1~~TRINITY_DN4076_c0_g1_i1.p2  ORF type:complete len:665 (+),score=82.64 TRINITY_DN4076_c0_g1_i1:3649-5643(+)